ncbi:sulfite exporter TauE/SafE family protein [Synechococcus sp. PCC 7336]|uniref:sulfite exporter TauE/SafE family protein n=1 Tax=Synechococcus sp. PCC 7336 TaxID=195250 RepID=UPI0003473BEF|nr:sulfite exporter TauE/SafE family protein [Synechococcus sp. PCC 7336]
MLQTLAIFFFATLIRATFGFGDALIAMPLLSLSLGVKMATPLFALVATSSALAIFVSTWSAIDFKAARQLFIASLIGIPIGLLLLKIVPESLVLRILGGFLVLFGLYRLIGAKLPDLKSPLWGYLFGFIAGVLGGAYNTNGPPIITYATLRRWPPEQFRATLQGYFFPTGLAIAASHGLSGLWTLQIFQLYLAALPAVLSATFIGSKIHQKLSPKRFERLLFLLLIVLGVRLAV